MKFRMLCCLFFVLASLSVSPGFLTAQQLPHSYARPDQVEVKHLHLDLKVDFESQRLRGTATLELNRKDAQAGLLLDTSGLDIDRVTTAEGNELKWQMGERNVQLGSRLSVELPDSISKVVVHYASRPTAEAVQWLSPQQTTDKQQPFLFTQSQAILARTWVPCQDTPAVRMTYSAKIQVPPELLAVMSASNPQEKNDSGVYEFEMKQPIPSYLLALAVGDLEYKQLATGIGVYAEPSVVERAAWELEGLPRMMDVAEELYGPYQWEKYDVIFLPSSFPFGGMENPRLTFATPTILAGDRSLVALIAHELAHSWSGNLVTNSTWNDFWLNEGFTVYFEQRIMEEIYGREYSEMLAKLAQDSLLEEIKEMEVRDTWLKLDLAGRNPDDGMTGIAYDKGYLFLRLLEEKTGRDEWDKFLRTYFDKFAFQSMTTESFLEYLKKNLEVDVDFDEWIYQPGLPKNCPVIRTDQLAEVEMQASRFETGVNAVDLETSDWTTHHWNHFLRSFKDGLSIEQLTALDAEFKFTESGNSEITHDWLLHVIRSKYEPGMTKLELFLTSQGRRKFLRPLYEKLAESDDGMKIAKMIYAKARPGYHAVSRQTIDGILGIAEADDSLQEKLEEKELSYHADPNDPDNLIWYARFLAYSGRFDEAINLYAEGNQKFPQDARMLRHRGHRLISVRRFDKAIADLERATKLIDGQPDQVEPDGMPNAQNIPVSTLHTNAWYHLGLAYYLKHDFENALRCYQRCRDVGTNDDNIVSSTHWLYMINRRLGRSADADKCLEPIKVQMNVIENTSYHRLCLLYKELITLEELVAKKGDGPSGSSIDYGIGNWHFYHGRAEEARTVFDSATSGEGKTAFGFIAAEADLAKAFDK